MLEIHLFLHLEFYLWSYGDWNCVTVRTSRNKYADAAHRNTNHCANFSSNVWDLLIFLSHLAVSPLPTVHVSFTSCLALYTLPPVRPFLWPAPWIMSLSLRAWNFKLLPVKATIFESVSVKFKLCLIVKSKECTSDSRYTPIFMHTHTRTSMPNHMNMHTLTYTSTFCSVTIDIIIIIRKLKCYIRK